MYITNSNQIVSKDIRESLKRVFKDYWIDDDTNFSPGIRGIHTIGSRNGTDVDWSIMNYFDTKREVLSKLNNLWSIDGGLKEEWLDTNFSDNEELLIDLLRIQWRSIKNGFENENKALENLKNDLNCENVSFELYPPGHVNDRYKFIDLTIKSEGKKYTFQIKPASKTTRLKNGGIMVHTYGMKETYKYKNHLDFILYNKDDKYVIFENKDYFLLNDNNREVIHMGKPVKIIEKFVGVEPSKH